MKSFHIKSLSIILIFCLGIIIYSNTFFASFQFDDGYHITNNFAIRDVSNLQNIWNFWPCRFITYLSIALNYHFNGLNVLGYHLFNLLVHLITAILVCWLVLLTFSTPVMKGQKITCHANAISLFAGLIFVSHPIQTEAVTYIVQRAASMATLFYLASLCLYIQSRLLQGTYRHLYYIGSLITAIMAMFTKETALTLPLIILLYEFSFFKIKGSINWRHLIPFFLTLFIIPLTMLFTNSVNFQEMRRVAEAPAGISPIHYLLTQFRVMVTYIRLAFLPFHQNLDYDYPVLKNIFEWPVLISLLFLISILYGAKCLFFKYRLVSFSIFWFFLTLLPESSFLPIKDVINEHRLYLPLVGYSILLVNSVYYLWGKNTFRGMVIALTMIIACYSILTYQRNKVWKDELTLWNDTVRKSPNKARPYSNRGFIYLNKGNFIKSMSDFNKAIAISPDDAHAYNNRGLVYYGQGNLIQALVDYDKAIDLDPNDAEAYNNRGNLYYKQGNLTQAMLNFNKAFKLNPHMTVAYNSRNFIYNILALSNYNKAIKSNPKDAAAYSMRCYIYLNQGDLIKAMSDCNKAIEIDPRNVEAYTDRGLTYAKQGNFVQAVSEYSKALEINPKYMPAYKYRAFSYYQLKEYEKVLADAHKAEGLRDAINH